jgi:ParB family chromosome partitioning protein
MSNNDPKKRGLGKGLDALFDEPKPVQEIVERDDSSKNGITEIKLSLLEPNPYQPRKTFDKSALDELANSIKENGVIQPLIVRKNGKKYQIVAGERRFRASTIAGLQVVPVIIKTLTDHSMMEIAIVENLQREDLNPIEEAQGINSYMKELGYTQEQTSEKLGKSRSAIANLLRLLNLPASVQKLVSENKLTMGHARTLLGFDSQHDMENLAKRIVAEGLSVRQVEEIVSGNKTSEKHAVSKSTKTQNQYVSEVVEKLEDKYATRVILKKKKIEINFTNEEDLNRILDVLGISLD